MDLEVKAQDLPLAPFDPYLEPDLALRVNRGTVSATLRFLAEIQPDFLVPCHCTGTHVAELLLQKFGDAVVKPGGAGMKIYAGTQKTESVLDSAKYPTRPCKHRDSSTRAED